MEKIFGIDLGTTYSCIAYVDEHGKPTIVPNKDNELTTPSVVCFESKESIIVGSEAKNMLKTDPEKVVTLIKRKMGDENYLFTANENDYKPEEVSAYILKKLVKDASDSVGYEVKDVVITCPAYFGLNEREATKRAGEIAGLNVKSIINEPTAAALAYGIDKLNDQTILVYDLGGGTFDVTMIQISPQNIEVKVTGGEHNLGGKNWDDRLMAYFADKFKDETNVEEDIFANAETYGDLQINSEVAKKSLSTREKTKVAILYGTDRANIEITKEKFDEITIDLAERTVNLTNKMLDDAKDLKGIETFDKILLVGGSTKIPQIKEVLTRNFPNVPIETFDPDESVAKGAAIYGHQLALKSEIIKKAAQIMGKSETDINLYDIPDNVWKQIEEKFENDGFLPPKRKDIKEIKNVISKSFGIEAYDNNNNKIVSNIIKIQSEIPFCCTKRYKTYEANQNNIKISVFENNKREDHTDVATSTEIGEGIIEGLPPNLPAGSPVEVTFKISEEGLLEVNAVEKTANNEVNFSIEIASAMSEEELAKAKERSNALIVS
ncbi:MAG: Hsp70 family protein [Marinilabiliaceae bacterium]|nr:Hsp70 family protein [Marinilabiliaceae bacterium]